MSNSAEKVYEDHKEYFDALLAKQFEKVDESKMDGKYHGPSNAVGMTSREYWDAWAEEQDERNDW
jgi:hypothetical protein